MLEILFILAFQQFLIILPNKRLFLNVKMRKYFIYKKKNYFLWNCFNKNELYKIKKNLKSFRSENSKEKQINKPYLQLGNEET